MSTIETLSDVNNTFLSRRELTCDFPGSSGKLKSMEAVDMVTKEFKLDGKVVIPMRLKTHVGMSKVTGTFYVYEDEGLAKKHINPTIFSRLREITAEIPSRPPLAVDIPAPRTPISIAAPIANGICSIASRGIAIPGSSSEGR